MNYRLPTTHQADTADSRFIRCENEQTPDYVYPPHLFIKTRNKFIERIRNLNEAANVAKRDDDV